MIEILLIKWISEMRGKERGGDARNRNEGVFENYNQLAEWGLATVNVEESGGHVSFGDPLWRGCRRIVLVGARKKDVDRHWSKNVFQFRRTALDGNRRTRRTRTRTMASVRATVKTRNRPRSRTSSSTRSRIKHNTTIDSSRANGTSCATVATYRTLRII